MARTKGKTRCPTSMSKADRALKAIAQIKKNVPLPELSWLDVNASPWYIPVGNTPVKFLLNSMARGDQQGTRDKRQIRMKHLNINLQIFCPGGATGSTVRVIVVLDRDADGATIPNTAFFADIGAIGLTQSFLNLDNRGRFKILRNDFFVTDPVTHPVVHREYYFNMNDIVTYNSGNTGSITDIEKNSLIMMVVSNEQTPNYPQLNFQARLRYVDN